jgi:hypothetical protein
MFQAIVIVHPQPELRQCRTPVRRQLQVRQAERLIAPVAGQQQLNETGEPRVSESPTHKMSGGTFNPSQRSTARRYLFLSSLFLILINHCFINLPF